jgi:predicted ATPase
MLTRLRVEGFKNLIDVDISFGPFTCIAGANGVGKSNLLDAISFLSALVDQTLVDAALAVRDIGSRTGDIRGLFSHVGEHYGNAMSFRAEMVIPRHGEDDLGREVTASSTFVEYFLRLRYKEDETARALGSIEIVEEELKHITLGKSREHLPFLPSKAWRDSAIHNARRAVDYISTDGDGTNRRIKLHQDGGGGRPQRFNAANLPRTVLSASSSAEAPTAALVRREMQSWRLLQLEPSSLRQPDSFTAPYRLSSDGKHLPATLYHLARSANGSGANVAETEVANRLGRLIDDVRAVYVDRDELRQLFTLYVKGSDGTAYPARALSDGTLRFLALSVLSLHPDSLGVICLEEPENGIHPQRIPAMIELLRDLATDVTSTEPDQTLQQVIINTHSPSVVMQVPDESLVLAQLVETFVDKRRTRGLRLRALPDTWRAKSGSFEAVSKGQLLAYLNPVPLEEAAGQGDEIDRSPGSRKTRRVIDRDDMKQYKIPFEELAG